MSPESMQFAVNKIIDSGNQDVMITDRGTMFGYQDLIVDFRGIPTMKSYATTVLDVTHSLQKPNQTSGVTGGLPNMIETIKSKNNFHPKLNVNLPSKLKVEKIEKLDELMKEIPDVLVVGVSSIGIDWFVDKIADKIDNKTSLVILTKGLSIVNKKLSTISDKIKIMLSEKGIEYTNISAIKGPCLAAGLANKIRTSTLIASPSIDEAKKLQKIISTDYYSTEISEDLNGVELSGAIKNIYSMIIGASEGLSSSSAKSEVKSKYFHNLSLIHI